MCWVITVDRICCDWLSLDQDVRWPFQMRKWTVTIMLFPQDYFRQRSILTPSMSYIHNAHTLCGSVTQDLHGIPLKTAQSDISTYISRQNLSDVDTDAADKVCVFVLPAGKVFPRQTLCLASSASRQHALQGWHTSQDAHIFVLFMFTLPASWQVYVKYSLQRWNSFIWRLRRQRKHARPAVTRFDSNLISHTLLDYSCIVFILYSLNSMLRHQVSVSQVFEAEVPLWNSTTGTWNWKAILHMNDCDECGRQKFQYVNSTKIIDSVVIFPYKHTQKTHWLGMNVNLLVMLSER